MVMIFNKKIFYVFIDNFPLKRKRLLSRIFLCIYVFNFYYKRADIQEIKRNQKANSNKPLEICCEKDDWSDTDMFSDEGILPQPNSGNLFRIEAELSVSF